MIVGKVFRELGVDWNKAEKQVIELEEKAADAFLGEKENEKEWWGQDGLLYRRLNLNLCKSSDRPSWKQDKR